MPRHLNTLYNPQEEIRHYKHRVIVISVLISFLVIALIARLIDLQITEHELYSTLSQQNLLSVAPVDPSRGLIYDRNGVLLAGNMPVYSLEITPEKITNLKQTIADLNKIIPITPSDIQNFYKLLSQKRQFTSVPIRVKLSDAEIATFALNQYRFPGVAVQAHMMRYYPFGSLMAPALGYVGRINSNELAKVDPTNYSATNYIGKNGIEKYYEPLLHGTVGIQQVEISANGQVVRSNQSRPAIAGTNIYLTIDSKLQQEAQQALEGWPGAVVAIDPRNGEILAFVSNPSFDPNPFVTGVSNDTYQSLQNDPQRPLFNRALQGVFPPGSSVKPYYALEGLLSGTITPHYGLFCPGFYKLPGGSHVYHDHKAHGEVNLESAIIVSCDTFFFNLGHLMGLDRIVDILSKFGYGQSTGVDTFGELTGLVPNQQWRARTNHQIWNPGDTVSLGIGQGYILVSPLQQATAMMRMADRGGGFVPHFLLRTESPSGQKGIYIPKPLPPIQIPSDIWDLVQRALGEVISDPRGTGYFSGHTATYTYSGKSGTAQVFTVKAGMHDKTKSLPIQMRDHSWFVAYSPSNNPDIVIAVFVEHGGEGHAALVVRRILDAYNGVPTPSQLL